MKNQVQLITYVDRLTGGGFADLKALVEGPLNGVIEGIHVLPFFDAIDGADSGFDPIDHTKVDPRLGDWSDVKALSESVDLMADLIVNHVSAQSPTFRDFVEKGAQSDCADMFLTFGKVFPDGASESDIACIYRPRPGLPFTPMLMGDGQKRLIWTTFSSEQIDIDVSSEKGREYLHTILQHFADSGIRAIRLDAAGYAIKKQGSNCFMIPETFTFLDEFSQTAKSYGIEVLVEIHSYYRDQIEIAEKVDYVYDFALPALVLQCLYTGRSGPLANWLEIAPRNAITVLDTHDGIGIVDVGAHPNGRPGLLSDAEIEELIETVHQRTNGQSREAMTNAPAHRYPYQVYSTYYDALGKRDNEYLVARALQFFCPGIPQVYYIGLLCVLNDMRLYRATRSGRDVNRRFLKQGELDQALRNPTVQSLIGLIRLRNTHPAFNGSFRCEQPSESLLVLSWEKGEESARLSVDFASVSAEIHYTEAGTEHSKCLEQFGYGHSTGL